MNNGISDNRLTHFSLLFIKKCFNIHHKTMCFIHLALHTYELLTYLNHLHHQIKSAYIDSLQELGLIEPKDQHLKTFWTFHMILPKRKRKNILILKMK